MVIEDFHRPEHQMQMEAMNILKIAGPLRARPWAAYLLAVGLTLAEFGGFFVDLETMRQFPFLLPLTAVTIAAFFGGTGPATLVAVASEPFLQYYVVGPERSFALPWPTGYIGMGFYLSLSAIIIFLSHGMFGALGRLQETQTLLNRLNEGLEERVAARTTELIAAQAELHTINDNLEKIVETRTGDLRMANEEIQRFAYIVSHDLRAPLVNVLGFTAELDALSAGLATFLGRVATEAPHLAAPDIQLAIAEDLPEAIGFIRSSTQKMDRLINAILKLSREGRRRLEPETIDMAALVAAQGASLSQQLAARNAKLEIKGTLPPVESDRLAIEQVFGNLIENAVKYLAPGRPGHVCVSGEKLGSSLRYDVADNGRGIETKDFGRVFELFRRSGEQDTLGEGIGLTYVQNLVRRLGGTVTMQSEFGVGSTFSVTLPSVLRTPNREPDGAPTRILI